MGNDDLKEERGEVGDEVVKAGDSLAVQQNLDQQKERIADTLAVARDALYPGRHARVKELREAGNVFDGDEACGS